MTKAQLLAVGSTAGFGGTVTECWYCGDTPTEPWRSQGWDEDVPRDMPMCQRHGDGVRESMHLRSIGADEAADNSDAENGIETRPRFNRWMPPNAK